MSKLELELYVVGHSPRSRAALDNLDRICATLHGEYTLEVIDVLEQPAAAEAANIMATPTLLKKAPLPAWRIIGDLSVREVVMRGLGIDDDMQGGNGDDAH